MQRIFIFVLALFTVFTGLVFAQEAVHQKQISGSSASLRGVDAVSDLVCWASGSGGTWLRTIDGGETWQKGVVPGAEKIDFRDVHAFSADSALLMGIASPARFYLTEDGGESWTLVHEDTRDGIFFDSIAFWDDKRGVAIADQIDGVFTIMITNDGGRKWRHVVADDIPPALPGEAHFAASGTCIAIRGNKQAYIATGGGAARVLSTENGGISWRVSATPLAPQSAAQGIFSILWVDGRGGMAVGGDYENSENGICLFSHDGQQWEVPAAAPAGYRSAIDYINDGEIEALLAVGKDGADISYDGGKSWQSVELPSVYALSFARGFASGWAVGPDGNVVKITLIQIAPK
jgi:photosystem II stability/assembly factor-like uncharacterized protein